MPSSYSKFKFEDLEALHIKVIEGQVLDKKAIDPVNPSEYLIQTLDRNLRQKLRSEKAKSEFLIAPILSEIEANNRGLFAFYSGYNFDVDKEKGLKGFCDFVLSYSPEYLYIEAPVFSVVEAKNDNLDSGIPQCVAEMYAAAIFNERKAKHIPVIYGATTFGFEWKFLKYQNNLALVDTQIYYLNELPLLLGALQHITTIQKPTLPLVS
jgi:hypothetical protein